MNRGLFFVEENNYNLVNRVKNNQLREGVDFVPPKAGAYIDGNGRVLTDREMDQYFNPFYGVEFIYRHGLVFLDQSHLEAFEKVTPGKLREDLEWASAVYMLTVNDELRSKTTCHLYPAKRGIAWDSILSNDFGSSHYAAIYWAFGLWGGNSWGGWQDDDGKIIPKVDTTSRAYSMDSRLKFVALVAQAYRWGLQGKIPALAKVFY